MFSFFFELEDPLVEKRMNEVQRVEVNKSSSTSQTPHHHPQVTRVSRSLVTFSMHNQLPELHCRAPFFQTRRLFSTSSCSRHAVASPLHFVACAVFCGTSTKSSRHTVSGHVGHCLVISIISVSLSSQRTHKKQRHAVQNNIVLICLEEATTYSLKQLKQHNSNKQ